MKCPNCSNELPISASVCPFCNAKITETNEANKNQENEERENSQHEYQRNSSIELSKPSDQQNTSNQLFSGKGKKIFSIICVLCIVFACLCGYQAYKTYNNYNYAYEFYKEAAQAQGDSIRTYIKLKDSEYYTAQALAGSYYSQYQEYKSIADKYDSICENYKTKFIVYICLGVACIAAPILVIIVKKRTSY